MELTVSPSVTQKHWYEVARGYNASNRVKNKDLKALFEDIGTSSKVRNVKSMERIN